MANKSLLSVVAQVLLVSVILGIVVVQVVKNGEDLEKKTDVTTKNEAINTICKPTEYKEACINALAKVAKNSSASYEDYIMAAFRSTMAELKVAKGKVSSTNIDLEDKNDEISKYAHTDLESCEKMLGHATDELQQVIKVVSRTKAPTLVEQGDQILVWLTAVRAYQTTCVDEIKDEKLRKDTQEALDTANKLTFNAQKIVYNLVDIVKDIGVDLGDFKLPSIGHRKLLEELEVIGHQGFPSWVSVADRRLLADKPIGQRIFKTPEPEPLSPIVTPDAVVALDGSGQFKSIKEALAAYHSEHQGRYIIYIKAGVYDEGQIIIDKKQNNVYMYGDGRDQTIITGDLNFGIQNIGTSQTATVVAQGERFMAKSIGFRNTIGPAGHQAVAFRSQSPHTVMVDCSFEGYQNTLYYHTHDQFYKNCVISGTVDFIFGSGRAFIQDSEIYVRKPDEGQGNMVTADGRMKYEEAGGVVLQNCKIMATPELEPVKQEFDSHLGRPWRASATAVIMQCDIGDVIRPTGWATWESADGKNNHMTCMFREFANKGPGSNTAARVTWPGFKVIGNEKEATQFSAGPFMNGGAWLSQAGVPVKLWL